MSGFPWLPLGYAFGSHLRTGRLISGDRGYQILSDTTGQWSILLLKPSALPKSVALDRFVAESDLEIVFGPDKYVGAIFPEDKRPVRVVDIAGRAEFVESSELMSLTNGLLFLVQTNPNLNWSTSLFIMDQNLCIPTDGSDDTAERLATGVSVMTGGIREATMSPKQIKSINAWLTIDDIGGLFAVLKPDDVTEDDEAPLTPAETNDVPLFHLPGQPFFTQIAKEYIIDHVRERERYEKMGVRMPNALLLSGDKGAGKTYAIKKLAAHLKWPLFEVGLGDVGSIYIHQTAKNFKRLFDTAAAKAPALIILNEVDALMGNRGPTSQDHKIEEVNELLRLIENAAERRILVIGTTNRKEGIDEAFLRKGRFDIQVQMKYPGEEQVQELIRSMLDSKPHLPGLNLDPLVEQLTGRPVSDIEWVINEAARMAVKARKDAIDDICLFGALSRLKKEMV
jgi:AAA+ superfamily predicted ATPase